MQPTLASNFVENKNRALAFQAKHDISFAGSRASFERTAGVEFLLEPMAPPPSCTLVKKLNAIKLKRLVIF